MACARSHTMTLLCAAKVRSRICVCGKEQLEVAEWCLVSPRQVRNWIRKDTNYFRDESLLLSRLPGV